MTRQKFYFIIGIINLAGLIWIAINFANGTEQTGSVCIFKQVTHQPCPACGSTRTILHLINGDLLAGIHYNPLGYFILPLLISLPLWITYDLILKKSSILKTYQFLIQSLNKKIIALPLIFLIIINWIWNIYKGL